MRYRMERDCWSRVCLTAWRRLRGRRAVSWSL